MLDYMDAARLMRAQLGQAKRKLRQLGLPAFSDHLAIIAVLALVVAIGLSYAPWMIALLLTVIFSTVLLTGVLQLKHSLLAPADPEVGKARYERFISVHVPAHNEPPEMLKETLDTLAAQNYDRYEVIVIDNNTTDPQVWQPIERHCEALGGRFKFYHVENLPGFKAGALNYVKDKGDPRTEVIAVVDADYRVVPTFLAQANAYFDDASVGYVQFPQAYRNVTKGNFGLWLEYQHFFQLYMNMANAFRCVTATGTLSFFRVQTLRAIGFFDSASITEDSDIGVRLTKAGYRGLYVPKVVGRGLMPFDLVSYKKQKARWALGNLQVLRNHFLDVVRDRDLSLPQKMGLYSQLTAWANFTFLPVLVILVASFVKATGWWPEASTFRHVVIWLAALSLITFIALKFLSFYRTFRGSYSLAEIARAFVVHVGLLGVYSTAFIRAFQGTEAVFERTNKFPLSAVLPGIQGMTVELWVALSGFFLGVFHLFSSNYNYAAVSLLIGVLYVATAFVARELIVEEKAGAVSTSVVSK